jgi:hypothetical protein
LGFVRTGDGNQYQFDSDSKIGNKIWKICDRETPCTVTGTVNKYDIFVSVTKVKRVN